MFYLIHYKIFIYKKYLQIKQFTDQIHFKTNVYSPDNHCIMIYYRKIFLYIWDE
jgi:hypothetical protein